MSARYVYVASSWRNPTQQHVVAQIRAAGIGAYDFKNPEAGTGFYWSEVGLQRDNDAAVVDEYLAALQHPRSIEGFDSDFDAMQRADAFVLVLPCGRSAHLELGWAVGAGKPTAILLEDPCTPELMYRMVDHLDATVEGIVDWLRGLPDPIPLPLTEAEFLAGCWNDEHRIMETEDGVLIGWGHQHPQAFADQVRAYGVEAGGLDVSEAGIEPNDVQHRWAITVDNERADVWFTFGELITAETPGSFPVTVVFR